MDQALWSSVDVSTLLYSLRDPLRGSLCSPAGKTSDPTSLAYQYETRSYFWGPMGHLKHFGGPKGDLWGTSEALWGEGLGSTYTGARPTHFSTYIFSTYNYFNKLDFNMHIFQHICKSTSAAHFIVFREKRRMARRELFREKWAAKNWRKIAGQNGEKWSEIDLKMANFQ